MRPQAIWIIIALVLVILNGAVFSIIYQNLTRGSTDLFPRWKGAALFWREGISPYDPQVGKASQEQIYGRLADPEEDQLLFAYPFYTVFLMLPFVPFSYQLAAGLLMHLLLLSLIAGLALWLHQAEWLPPPLVLAWMVLWTVVAYFSVRGLLLGQLVIFAYLGQMIACWGIQKGHDRLAGLGLLLCTLKPQTGLLFVPFLLLWAGRFQRHSLWQAFGLGFALLMGLSFVLEPSWFGDWLTEVRRYETYTETIATAEILASSLPVFSQAFYLALVLCALGSMFWVWKTVLWDGHSQMWFWAANLSLTVTLLLAPRTATTSYVHLYPVLYALALVLVQRRQWLLFYGGGLALLLGYWALHIATVPPVEEGGAGREAPIVYVIFPLLIWGLLWAEAWRANHIQPILNVLKFAGDRTQ